MKSFFCLGVALAAALLLPGVVAAQGKTTADTKMYIVQLSESPLAVQHARGALSGAGTRLSAGGSQPANRLDVRSAPARAYVGQLDRQRAVATSQLPIGARPLHQYRFVFNGFSVALKASQVATVRALPGVLSVTEAETWQPDTTNTPQFLGLSTPGGLWSQLDGASVAIKGEDVVVGVLDTGIWPENPSFANPAGSAYGPPPAQWKGVCQTGPGFPAKVCNNKVVGARFYDAGFLSVGGTLGPLDYHSPRDSEGHGSHTASTAAGNSGVMATGSPLVSAAPMSGIAPRARLAIYKVCWAGFGCNTTDILAAMEDAVADGVDVVNLSISGTRTNLLDPMEVAFLNAAAAGVFVSASAGNNGPGNSLSHPSPWLTTVGASGHDRLFTAQLVLGAPSGAAFSGSSYQNVGVPQAPMILSRNAGLVPYESLPTSGESRNALDRCYTAADRLEFGGADNAALDPAKVAGKIVVCRRGTNGLSSKGDAVRAAGGVAVVILNTSDGKTDLPMVAMSIPGIVLPVAAGGPVTSYSVRTGATATLSPGAQVSPGIAPVMATFSSRGPNLANASILKPDITAPGVDILAGYVATLTQEQHDAVVNGTWVPPAAAALLQGTSMSSPHVAGAAALLKQAHRNWSPAAIKSALMTTAANSVKLPDGSPDTDRWGYGAGHLTPTPAANPGLIYEATADDYTRFLCGVGLTPPSGRTLCQTLGNIAASDLNLASITVPAVAISQTVRRRVRNDGLATATFAAAATLPGWRVRVTPQSITLAPGASAEYEVLVARNTAASGVWAFGELVWSDGIHAVRSPLSAKGLPFKLPELVADHRVAGDGSITFTIMPDYTGTLLTKAQGLVAASGVSGQVAAAGENCHDIAVPANLRLARFALFNADTTRGGAGTDIDMMLYAGPQGTGAILGISANGQSDESLTLSAPTAGIYSVCVRGVSTPGGAVAYTLSYWLVNADSAQPATLRSGAASTVMTGNPATVALRWAVPAGNRYLGLVDYFNNGSSVSAGTTTVLIDNK